MMHTDQGQLEAHLTPAGAWAFAVGTAVGWGSLVVTSTSFLAQAGPLGSVLGLLLGMVIMLIVSRSYAYLMDCFPESGGAYAYAREAFGYDHGFLNAWFLALIYLAMLWANATSLPLFSRIFLGEVFHFGRLYSIFGYEVYLGEALISIAAIVLVALISIRFRQALARVMVALVALFTLAIAICFAAAMLRLDQSMSPAFVPDSGALSQILRITRISPWAFIGFECVSHATEEFSFRRSRIGRILIVALITTTGLYLMLLLLSVTAFPPQYATWLDYVRDLNSLTGLEALPAFYAAAQYAGSFGVTALTLALLALVLTSLIGNIFALSGLLYAVGRDQILPARFGRLNGRKVPANAIWLIVALSVAVPFLGRTAIGWIVDTTTLGAILIYGFVCACAWKTAGFRNDRREKCAAVAGLCLMVGFGLYLLLPTFFAAGTMETQTYFLFVVWAMLGFVYFRSILRRDGGRRFGKSIVVWIALLSLILFVSLVWMSQSNFSVTTGAMSEVQTFYEAGGDHAGGSGVVARGLADIRRTNAVSIMVVVLVFIITLVVLINNYAVMNRRMQDSEKELGLTRSLINTDSLTGVKSKFAFVEKEREMDARITDGSAEAFAVAVCDVNGLKQVNDTLGHQAGDDYIRAASRLICELFDHSPVYRIGGDEFVAVMTGRDYENRQAILATLHEKSVAHIGSLDPVISGGVAEWQPGTDSTMRPVFERADAKMYQEKRLLKSLGAPVRGA